MLSQTYKFWISGIGYFEPECITRGLLKADKRFHGINMLGMEDLERFGFMITNQNTTFVENNLAKIVVSTKQSESTKMMLNVYRADTLQNICSFDDRYKDENKNEKDEL